ncbi:thioredoxin family protein [Candidatus Pelagibacter sp.]|nr:thioredoxin family protein [Candidatus Pelagibacter sp.]|tara:strand:- start:288 stop:659 length:372 start_codon:yes stop_codon:yes gene_type:complete
MIKKFLILLIILIPINSIASEKKTTFDKKLFEKAQSDGKVVIVSSWIKYCYSCASQMKVLNKAKADFENIEYFAFDVTNKEISNLFNVQYQSTILIFKDNKEVYRSIGETTKNEIYSAINKFT